jgi:autotransporter-associated beta strand protein
MTSWIASSCRRALPLALPLILMLIVVAILRPPPAADTLPMASPALPAPRQDATAAMPRAEVAAALDAFDKWLADGRYPATLAQGVELARERRAALKELIQTDPQAALERAMPYARRRQLPEEIGGLLEEPVSTTADLDVEQACGGPGGRSWRTHWLMLGDERVRVFTYGDRAEVMTKQKLSVHGIVIDEVMAMWDDPLRELPAEEAADRGLTGRVAQLGKRLLEVGSDAALEAARQQLRETEKLLGTTAMPAYRELALGQMDGMFPLAMQGGAGGTDDDLPPVAFSPATEGAKKILYIRARFADEAPTYEPVELSIAQARQGEAEAFWQENSYGKSSLTTTYTTVVTLPKNGGDYVNQFNTLHLDARAAAFAANPTDWNHTKFDLYTVITNTATNAQGNGFDYSGIAQLGGKASHLLRNFISVRTASHEYGHNLGLNHSEYWLTDAPSPIGGDSKPGGYAGDAADDERIEYGHKFAIMSGQNAAGDFDSGRAHYAASDKNRLDWLVAGDGGIVSTTTSGTIRLHRHDVRSADFGSMTRNVARAIKINLPATDPSGFADPYKYWLSYRMLPSNGIAGAWLPNGLQVDWRRDGEGFRAVQLDMTPYSRDSGPYGITPGPFADNDDKEDAVLLVGRTFSDSGADIHFTPVAKGGSNPNEWLDVVVNIGTQGNNAAPVISNFTVSNPNPATGELVNFAITATDPDGDTLAYHWDVGDNTVQPGQLNKITRAKLWNNAGYYVVRVEVSDMKGGKTTTSAVIRVGTPTNQGMIHGRVTHAGRPVEGAYIRGGAVDAWTDSNGSYVLAGLPMGGVTVTAAKTGLSFTPQFTNPVQVTESGAFGIDFTANEPWTGGGGTVAMVTPYQIELALGFATRFTAQAFDGSGNPVAFNPTWSVSGGGLIGSNGVFEAQSLGDSFVVTAQSGGLTATAEVTVVNNGGPPPANGIWTNASGGSWVTTSSWAGGIIAGGAGNTADFSTLDPTADSTVTLDAARAIGNLVFGDTNTGSAATWFLTNGSGGSLLLAGTTPTITVNPLGPGKFANMGARLSGFNGFTKNGSGNLILNNATNTLTGPITLNAGNIQLNSASLTNATSVFINAGSLVVATSAANAIGGIISFGGGNLQFNNPPGSDYSLQFSTAASQPYRISVTSTHEATFNSNLASPGGTLTKLGTGTLILGAANSYNSGTTISAGTLRFGNASALGSGNVSFSGNATLQAGVAATLAKAVSIATGVTGTLDTNGNNTTISGTLTGDGALTKTGSGTLNIAGAAAGNTLTGAINVNAGTLAIDNVTPSPGIQSFANMNGAITVASGASFNFSQSFTAETLDNNITLSGPGTGGLGALNLWRNATATGAITLAADATISHTFNTAAISGPITGTDRNLTLTTLNANQPGMSVSGPIQLGTGGITVAGAANSGNFSIRLSGNNSYSGETRVASGTLMLSGDARIHDSSTVRIDSGAVLHLDFTGSDTVAALFLGGVAMPDGSYGSPTSPATHRSPAFAGNGILQVGVAYNYESWAASQAPPVTGGPNGDHDNDGVKNLVEYALSDGGERGVLSGSTITFAKRGAPYGGDLTYIIETSETLEANSWSPAVTHGPAQLGSPITFDFAPIPGTPEKFARLKIVKSP